MTIHTISSHTLDGSEVWGPYTAPDDSAWIKVKINTPLDPPYQRQFREPLSGLIERSSDGETWEHYDSFVWYGDDYQFPPNGRDSYAFSEFWASIKDDGYQYRVTISSGYAETIFGEVEFDTTSSRPTINTGSNKVGIVDYHLVRIQGAGGHGVAFMQECSSRLFAERADNAGIVVLAPGHVNTFVYPGTTCIENVSTGDFMRCLWGEDGDEIPEEVRSGRACNVVAPIYVKRGISEQDYVHVKYLPEDIDDWLSGGTPPEERDLGAAPNGTIAFIVVNNLNQLSPVADLFESGDVHSAAIENPYEGGSIGFEDTLSTQSGQLLLTAGSYLQNVPSEPFVVTPSTGVNEIIETYSSWNGSDFPGHGGGSDEWVQAIGYKVADGDSDTLAGFIGTVPAAWDVGDTRWAVSVIALSETPYCHMVVVETPGDSGDLPDADQIRSGHDGFDAPALSAQSRGPDENGQVTFDPFTHPSIGPNTSLTACFVWEGESQVVTYQVDTAEAIYCATVETPGDPGDLPDADQIKAGTDGFDDPAVNAQIKTFPAVGGQFPFDEITGLTPGTSYTVGFVYADEDPVYSEVETLENTVDGDFASAGDSSASATGTALINADYLSAGLAQAAAIGLIVVSAALGSAGTSTGAAVGASRVSSTAAASCIASASAVGRSSHSAVAATSCVSTVAAICQGIGNAVASTEGISSAAAIGDGVANSVASSGGTSDGDFAGNVAGEYVAAASGTSSVLAIGAGQADSVAGSDGTSGAGAVGVGLTIESGVASGDGTCTAQVDGRSTHRSAASAVGQCTTGYVGSYVGAGNVATAAGVSDANAVGSAIAEAVYSAQGVAAANATGETAIGWLKIEEIVVRPSLSGAISTRAATGGDVFVTPFSQAS